MWVVYSHDSSVALRMAMLVVHHFGPDWSSSKDIHVTLVNPTVFSDPITFPIMSPAGPVKYVNIYWMDWHKLCTDIHGSQTMFVVFKPNGWIVLNLQLILKGTFRYICHCEHVSRLTLQTEMRNMDLIILSNISMFTESMFPDFPISIKVPSCVSFRIFPLVHYVVVHCLHYVTYLLAYWVNFDGVVLSKIEHSRSVLTGNEAPSSARWSIIPNIWPRLSPT